LKSLAYILVIIMAAVLCIGALASAGGGGSGGSEGTVNRIETVIPSGSEWVQYGYFENDEKSSRITTGILNSETADVTAFGFVFQNLTVGKRYMIQFDIDSIYNQASKTEYYHLRTGGSSDTVWDQVSVGSYNVVTGGSEGAFVFVAESTSAELFLRKYPFQSDSTVTESQVDYMKSYVNSITIYEEVITQ